MKVLDSINDIKDNILKVGGLYIFNRQTGKTKFLIEILIENPEFILVVPNPTMKRSVIDSIRHIIIESIIRRIMTNTEYFRGQVRSVAWSEENVIVDEYFHHPEFIKYFRIAFSSMVFPIQTFKVRNDVNWRAANRNNNKRMYEMEYTMRFK